MRDTSEQSTASDTTFMVKTYCDSGCLNLVSAFLADLRDTGINNEPQGGHGGLF